jgi:hypothetical protein
LNIPPRLEPKNFPIQAKIITNISLESSVVFWGDKSVDWRIILKWNLKKLDVGVWTGLSWLRIETGDRHL